MKVERPNLVLVIADEFRADALGHLDPSLSVTPDLDALAADGVSFANAFCQNPVCVPSRVSLMTGAYPHVQGHRTQSFLLRPGESNLLTDLRSAGYHVWWAGKNDLLTPPAIAESVDQRISPDPPDPEPFARTETWPRWWSGPTATGYYSHYAGLLPSECEDDLDRRRVGAAMEFLEGRDTEDPFCLLLTLDSPHCPYAVTEPWFGLVDRSAVPSPTPPPSAADGKPAMMRELRDAQGLEEWGDAEWRELRATYYGMCARTDALVGDLLDALRRTGRYDDTVIIFTSDHGDYAGDFGLPEKAQNLFEDAITRVPLIIKPAATSEVAPGVRDALVELVDVRATVEELCGLPRAPGHFGSPLGDIIAGRRLDHRTSVICEGGRMPGERAAMELRARQEPEGLYYPRMRIQRTDDVAHGKAVMLRTSDHKYVRRLFESDELYDLRSDPRERVNRVDDPRYAQVAADLRDELLTRLIASADHVPDREDAR